MKHILVIFLAITVMIGVCGCMYRSFDPRQTALEHLQGKYGEEFTVVMCLERNLDAPFDEVLCRDSAGRETKVYITEEDEGLLIQDNYYAVLKHPEYKQLLAELAEDFAGEYKLFTNFMADFCEDSFTGDVPIRAALAADKEGFFSQTYFFVKESAADGVEFEALCAALENQGLTLYVAVYAVADSTFDAIDEARDVNEYLPVGANMTPIFEKTIR